MRAVIYTTGEFPSRLCADWLRLAAGHPMAGPEWRRSWWGAYGRGLETAVGAVYRDNTLVALAPWYLDRRGWLGRSISAMGDGKACTDYQRVLLDPQLTSEEAGDALTILVDAFRRSPSLARVSAWVMEGVVSDDESMCQLRARLVSEGFEAIEESLESSWVLPLPATWNEFAAGVHRSLRRKINKAARRYEQGEVRFEAATTRSEIEAAWDDFVRLHGLRFRDRDENGGCFSDPRFGAFLRPAVLELADRGAAELVWVRAADAIVSMQLHLLGGGTSYMYQSGIDPAQMQLEPGHLLYTQVVRRLIERGFERLDFLRGNEPYKADWGARPRALARLICVAPHAAARVRYRALGVLRRLRRSFVANSAFTAPSRSVTDGPPGPSEEATPLTSPYE